MGVAGTGGGLAFTFFHPPILLAISVAVGAAVVLFGVAALGLLLWTLVYGDDVPREQAFRFMRFVANKAEPPAPEFVLVPPQTSRAELLSGAQGQATVGSRSSAFLRPGTSQHLARVGSPTFIATTNPGVPGVAVRRCRRRTRGS
jgi:hypothetical protein